MQKILTSLLSTFVTNWKTTISGIVAGVAALIAADPSLFGLGADDRVVAISKIVVAGGLGFLGISAKQQNVTGGSKVSPLTTPDTTAPAPGAKP